MATVYHIISKLFCEGIFFHSPISAFRRKVDYNLPAFPMPEDIRDRYTEEEHEFLIAVSDGYYGGDVYSDESLHEAQFEILGKIDLTTGKKIKGRGSASWIAAKYPNTVEYNNYFDKVNDSVKEIVHPKTIYRVKGYAPIDPVNKPLYFFLERHMNGLYISEILSFGEQDEFLQSILDMYFTKKTITSPVLGELVFNLDLMWYSTIYATISKAVLRLLKTFGQIKKAGTKG